MSALSEQEKVWIRHYCGYLNVQEAQTFVLGTPASVETQFIIEGAMNRVLSEALPLIRRIMTVLDQIEQQMIQNLELLQITQIDTIRVNSTGPDKEQAQLKKQYLYWLGALCNALGIAQNPFDKRFSQSSIGGINVRVAH